MEETRSLVRWLSEAKNVKELTLEFYPPLGWDETRELLETTLWPRLQAVRLAGIRCDEVLMAGFVARHMLEVRDFAIIRIIAGVQTHLELVALTKTHLEQLLVKSARYKCWRPSDIKLTYRTRQQQRECMEAKGYVADASLSLGLLMDGVPCALHAAACPTTG